MAAARPPLPLRGWVAGQDRSGPSPTSGGHEQTRRDLGTTHLCNLLRVQFVRSVVRNKTKSDKLCPGTPRSAQVLCCSRRAASFSPVVRGSTSTSTGTGDCRLPHRHVPAQPYPAPAWWPSLGGQSSPSVSYGRPPEGLRLFANGSRLGRQRQVLLDGGEASSSSSQEAACAPQTLPHNPDTRVRV